MASKPVRITEFVKFGDDFELDVRAYELRRGGRSLKLERIPMELLVLLVELRGQLVTREQICRRVMPPGGWPPLRFLQSGDTISITVLPAHEC